MPPAGSSLAELLAAGLAKKHRAMRERIGLPQDSSIEGLGLESLHYHLVERSGPVAVRLEGESVRVSDPGASTGIVYTGAAAEFLLKAWNITREQARSGCRFEVTQGKRVTS